MARMEFQTLFQLGEFHPQLNLESGQEHFPNIQRCTSLPNANVNDFLFPCFMLIFNEVFFSDANKFQCVNVNVFNPNYNVKIVVQAHCWLLPS